MTQGIERMLGLPPLEDALKDKGLLPQDYDVNAENDDDDEPLDEGLSHMLELAKSAEQKIKTLEGTDHAEAMDQVFKETLKHAQDIMDLGFNIDHARAARMFEVASGMYGRAMEAKDAKRKRQLETMKLMLEQRRLDLDEKRINHIIGERPNEIESKANVVVEDRNELIRRMRAQMKGD